MEIGRTELAGRMRHGALEYCALSLLSAGEWGAFELVRTLAGTSGLADREGPVYPVLARMRRDGLVDTIWREVEPGRAGRVYRITDAGTAALAAFVRDWLDFRTRVDAFLGTAGG